MRQPPTTRWRITRGMLFRMVADAVLVIGSLAAGCALRALYVLAVEMNVGEEPSIHIRRALQNFLVTAVPLTVVLLGTFAWSGFYTYSKNYLSRYKALVVFRAVALGFLLFAFLSYFFVGALTIPRGALILAWALCSVALVSARVWSELWQHVVREREHILRDRGPIRNVLVIGGGGYIGSALVPILLQNNYRVHVLDILLFGEAPLEKYLSDPRLRLTRGDFRNVETLYQAMEEIDAVVHLGAIVGDPACKYDEDLTIDINLISTRLIAEVAKSRGVRRFIFASTCSVYGASQELLDERSETRPLSLYGRTKLASERLLLEMATPSFSPTILRFATIYGLSGRTRFDLVVNLMTARARLEGEITVHGGDQWRPFVHVEDAARSIAVCLGAESHRVAGEIFNVGSEAQNYTIAQVGEQVAQSVPGTRLTVDAQNEDPRNYRVSFRKIEHTLGFQPSRTLADGIQQVLEAIANGEIVDYEDPRYSNAKYLSQEGAAKFARHEWAHQMLQELHE